MVKIYTVHDFLKSLLNPQDSLQWAILIFVGIWAISFVILISGLVLTSFFDKLYDWTGKSFFWTASEFVENSVQLFARILKWPFRIVGYFILGVLILYLLYGVSGGLIEYMGL